MESETILAISFAILAVGVIGALYCIIRGVGEMAEEIQILRQTLPETNLSERKSDVSFFSAYGVSWKPIAPLPQGPLCPQHKEALYYLNFRGNRVSVYDYDLLSDIESGGGWKCPYDDGERFSFLQLGNVSVERLRFEAGRQRKGE